MGVQNLKWVTWRNPADFRDSLSLVATINMCTKFEISTFTYYKDMKGDEKCENLGGLGSYGSLKVQGRI